MKELKHGDKITITQKYVRKYLQGKCYYHTLSIEPIEAVYLGKRTVSNGFVREEGDAFIDEGQSYITTEYLVVFLVSPSLTRNPIYVPIQKDK